MDDTLSDIFRRIRLTGCVYFERDFWSPWAMRIDGTGFAQFHIVTRGPCVVTVDGVDHDVAAGDIVLFPRGKAHVLADARGRSAEPGGDVMASFATDMPRFATGDRATRLICGHYDYRARPGHPLIDSLPEMIHLRSPELIARHGIQATLPVLMRELAEPRPGATSVVERLAEVLLVQVLRAYFDDQPQRRGFFAGLSDPRLARAIARIHREVDASLTLGELAQAAGMSRSAFALHFKRTIGLSPIEYLAKWRMHDASDLLQDRGLSVAQVAERVGYEFEIAFARAFKRTFDVTPSEFRRRASGAHTIAG